MACPLGCRGEKGEVSRVERREVETHRTCCPMRAVKCEHCSVSVKACDMNGHLEVCKEFPIPCPNKCSEEFRVKRKGKSIHLSQECPLQETECPYSQYGCEVKVQRRNLEQHEKEDIHKHLKLTVKEIDHLKRFQYLLIPKGNLDWTIVGVKNKISQNATTFSDPFYVGLYKFQGKISWNGAENCVGLYLIVMKGEWDDTLKWPIRYKRSMTIFNLLDGKDSNGNNDEITEEDLEKYPKCFSKPITGKNLGLGTTKFISHADLLQEKYYKHDSVMLNFSVELILTEN